MLIERWWYCRAVISKYKSLCFCKIGAGISDGWKIKESVIKASTRGPRAWGYDSGRERTPTLLAPSLLCPLVLWAEGKAWLN